MPLLIVAYPYYSLRFRRLMDVTAEQLEQSMVLALPYPDSTFVTVIWYVGVSDCHCRRDSFWMVV
jgi:hypothetical protein